MCRNRSKRFNAIICLTRFYFRLTALPKSTCSVSLLLYYYTDINQSFIFNHVVKSFKNEIIAVCGLTALPNYLTFIRLSLVYR